VELCQITTHSSQTRFETEKYVNRNWSANHCTQRSDPSFLRIGISDSVAVPARSPIAQQPNSPAQSISTQFHGSERFTKLEVNTRIVRNVTSLVVSYQQASKPVRPSSTHSSRGNFTVISLREFKFQVGHKLRHRRYLHMLNSLSFFAIPEAVSHEKIKATSYVTWTVSSLQASRMIKAVSFIMLTVGPHNVRNYETTPLQVTKA
jgi:hypothetical protein